MIVVLSLKRKLKCPLSYGKGTNSGLLSAIATKTARSHSNVARFKSSCGPCFSLRIKQKRVKQATSCYFLWKCSQSWNHNSIYVGIKVSNRCARTY